MDGGNRPDTGARARPRPGHDDVTRELHRIGDEQRRTMAVDRRRHEASLRDQATLDGTFAGVLVDLAERGVEVVVHTKPGRAIRGRVEAVAGDHVRLAPQDRWVVLVALTSISHLTPDPSAPPSAGDREITPEGSLIDAISHWVGSRAELSVVTGSGATVVGLLAGCGADVVTVEGQDRKHTYVPVAAIADVTFSGPPDP